jgi:hypothetical protein
MRINACWGLFNFWWIPVTAPLIHANPSTKIYLQSPKQLIFKLQIVPEWRQSFLVWLLFYMRSRNSHFLSAIEFWHQVYSSLSIKIVICIGTFAKLLYRIRYTSANSQESESAEEDISARRGKRGNAIITDALKKEEEARIERFTNDALCSILTKSWLVQNRIHFNNRNPRDIACCHQSQLSHRFSIIGKVLHSSTFT